MKEQAQALKICRYLDQGAEQLPYRVVERLAASRAAALAKLAASPSNVASDAPTLPVARQTPPVVRESRVPLWWRVAATAVPLLMLLAGIFVVDTVHQEQSAAELAEVDSALLTDDVPLVAYADHGFGVYIRNTRR
jgi:hypothetical protein